MLSERSKQIRRDTIALSKSNGGYHYGPCFSIVEILIALYDHILTDNDTFILSKGHACWPWYVLLRERGLNPRLTGHPERDPHNGIECTSGSLGHGLPTGIGIALAKKQLKEPGKVYVLMGDGECQEGTTWESLLIAAKYKLDNLVVIVDKNDIQGSGFTKDILFINNMDKIVEIIGWDVWDANGHDVEDIKEALICAPRNLDYRRPKIIFAYTIKGRGISFMENEPSWHAKWPKPEQEAQALKELQ
jgi:transketolase